MLSRRWPAAEGQQQLTGSASRLPPKLSRDTSPPSARVCFSARHHPTTPTQRTHRNEQATERELCPGCGFLEQQDAAIEQPITPQMLMIVSSWLAEVAFEFSMQQETLFLAVGLLGRFLDASTVRGEGGRRVGAGSGG